MSDSDSINKSATGHYEHTEKIVISDTDTEHHDFSVVSSVKPRKCDRTPLCGKKDKQKNISNTHDNETHTIKVPHTDHMYRDIDDTTLSNYSAKSTFADPCVINKACCSASKSKEGVIEESHEPDVNRIVVPHTDHVFRDLRNANITPDVVNASQHSSDMSNISNLSSSDGRAKPVQCRANEDEDENIIRLKHSDHADADVSPSTRRDSARSSSNTSVVTSTSRAKSCPTSDTSIDSITLPRSDHKRYSITPDIAFVPQVMLCSDSGINADMVPVEDREHTHEHIVVPHTDTVFHDLGRDSLSNFSNSSSKPNSPSISATTTTATRNSSEPVDDGRISISHSDNDVLDVGKVSLGAFANSRKKEAEIVLHGQGAMKGPETRLSENDSNQIRVNRSDGRNGFSILKMFGKK